MRIGVPKERAAGERRVAMTPQVALRLIEERHELVVERGAGEAAGFADAAYAEAGAEVTDDAAAPWRTGVTLVVTAPSEQQADLLSANAILLGFLDPFDNLALMRRLADQGITAFAMEAVPRTTLAQSMDALSSQATAAGYQAVLMFTTAAGTIPPSKVLVLGAGVAGLQAIATAKRLGAVVFAYDIRPEVQEQIESLGARFVAAPTDESAAAATGYAKEVADDTQRRQLAALAPHVAEADVVITTAQIPGRPAPLLVSREMVESMRPGSVIVDLASTSGGNCELSRPDQTVEHDGVTILGPTDLASQVAHDTSQMYARNLATFLQRLGPEGEAVVDMEDEIIAGTCITHDGQVVHPVVRRLLDQNDTQEAES
jgi:NAD(P) transhydrogenase subunit alpha